VFEIAHPDLGSQDALGAGGRYDNLVKELDGPDVGAIGFAFGVERLFLVSSCAPQVSGKGLVYLITLGEEAKKSGINLIHNLRNAGIICDTDYEGKSLKGAMRLADDLKAKFVLILGENELKNNTITLKDMTSAEQKEIEINKIIAELTSRVKV
jgi:histidyl-tRNA synthetase